MDHGRFLRRVGSRKKVVLLCLLTGLLLVTVLVSPALAQTGVVSLPTQFDGFMQREFFDLAGIRLEGQILSVDFVFDDGVSLESFGPVWAELFLQTGPHNVSNANGDYPYSQYVAFGPGTTAHLLDQNRWRLDIPMADWTGGETTAPAPTLAVLSTDHGLAGADMIAYPSAGHQIGGVHYEIVLPDTGETIHLGRIALKLSTADGRQAVPIVAVQPPTRSETGDTVATDSEVVTIPDVITTPDVATDADLVPRPIEESGNRYALSDLGATSRTAASNGPFVSGFGRIRPDVGSTTPSGLLILGYRPFGTLATEVIVPDSPLITAGRIHAEVTPDGIVTTGVVIVNPNGENATISFELRNQYGEIQRTGSFTVNGATLCDPGVPCNQLGRFLDEEPLFSGPDLQGTLTIISTAPVSVFAMRRSMISGMWGEFHLTSLPVIDLSISSTREMQVIPHFAVGEGRTTNVILVNPTGAPLNGTLEFLDPYGARVPVTIDGFSYPTHLEYSLAPNGSQNLGLVGALTGIAYGSVRVVPSVDGPTPASFVIHGYRPSGVSIYELGIPVTMGTAFRLYAERSPADQVETGIAIANATDFGGTVWLSLTASDGSLVAGANYYLPAGGQIVDFLASLLPSVANQAIQGVLRITTDLPSISVAGWRARYNERQDFLVTGVPIAVEYGLSSSDDRFFPLLLNGGGFTADIVLFSGKAGQSSSGHFYFVQSDGLPLALETGQ